MKALQLVDPPRSTYIGPKSVLSIEITLVTESSLQTRGRQDGCPMVSAGDCQLFCVSGLCDRLSSLSGSPCFPWEAVAKLNSKLPHRGRPINPSPPFRLSTSRSFSNSRAANMSSPATMSLLWVIPARARRPGRLPARLPGHLLHGGRARSSVDGSARRAASAETPSATRRRQAVHHWRSKTRPVRGQRARRATSGPAMMAGVSQPGRTWL
jgi:hypothetical protein